MVVAGNKWSPAGVCIGIRLTSLSMTRIRPRVQSHQVCR